MLKIGMFSDIWQPQYKIKNAAMSLQAHLRTLISHSQRISWFLTGSRDGGNQTLRRLAKGKIPKIIAERKCCDAIWSQFIRS
jgi:hypothetical protein